MNLFNTRGRIGRLTYFTHSMANSFVFVLIIIVTPLVTEYGGFISIILMFILIIINFYIEVCLSVKRFHDLDRSGFYFLIIFIPIINIVIGFELMLRKGTIGPNRFGEDPLQKQLSTPVPDTISPHQIPPAPKAPAPPAYTIAPPVLQEERNLIPVYIAGAVVLSLLIYLIYQGQQFSQQKMNYHDREPGYISTTTMDKLYKLDDSEYQPGDSSYLVPGSMIKLCSSLWDTSFSGIKHLKINYGSESVSFDLERGAHGTILSLEKKQLISTYKNNLLQAGFLEHTPADTGGTTLHNTLRYKHFCERDGRIYIQVGMKISSIHYFIDYLIGNLLVIDSGSKFQVEYE